jgi:Zn-dependent protease
LTVILGWNALDNPNPFLHLFIWVAVVFLSILLHEFGHIWMGKAFGSDGYIVLYSFGGLAVGSNDVRYRWQRILVSLAGPAIQLILYAALRGGLYLAGPGWLARQPDAAVDLFRQLLVINLYWPLLNLLPVFPLDGGQAGREVCTYFSPHRGLRASLVLSVAVAGLLCVNALVGAHRGEGFLRYAPTGQFTALLFGMLAVESYMLLQRTQTPWRYEAPDDRTPWER